ncbi:hypothetical protein NLG42_21565 [Flavobacterium plurextorum]|uniref:hypothetical protein n=1 Tax=Flavobacterium TaxID=237 RepID=UPI00214D7F02|nr:MULTISPECIES: hypothetical protein [Flavobacterium]UUW08680.1 hypothetical protein NLG42_21565 [Flavobacterium plurextorum]
MFENFNIPLKDLFYLIGIIATLYLGIKNISLSNKNRKNSLRESVFKEQITFMLKLSSEVIKLHRSLSFLNNKTTVTDEQQKEIIEQILIIHEVLLTYSVICSNNVLELTKITIDNANTFLEYKIGKNESSEEKYNEYVVSFTNIMSQFKKELGIEKLKKENESLFT